MISFANYALEANIGFMSFTEYTTSLQRLA